MHPEKNWKYYLGLSLFGYSFVPILTVELLFFLPISHAEAASLAVIYVGSGEVAFFAAIALLGRPFVDTLKTKLKSFFIRNKPARPPRPIGKTRHTIGVILFFASFLPYPFVVAALMFLHPTGRDIHYLVAVLLAGDGIFITSLFVLGGEFWERLKRLFEWPGKQQAA